MPTLGFCYGRLQFPNETVIIVNQSSLYSSFNNMNIDFKTVSLTGVKTFVACLVLIPVRHVSGRVVVKNEWALWQALWCGPSTMPRSLPNRCWWGHSNHQWAHHCTWQLKQTDTGGHVYWWSWVPTGNRLLVLTHHHRFFLSFFRIWGIVCCYLAFPLNMM